MTAREVRVPLRALRKDFASLFERLGGAGDLAWVRVGQQRFLLVNGPDQVREVLVDRPEELVKPRSQTIRVGRPSEVDVDDSMPVQPFRRALARGMGAGRVGAALEAIAQAAAIETADWRDGVRVPLMGCVRRIAVRWATRAAFGSRLTDDEIARAETVMRWFDREPRVVTRTSERRRRLTPHGLRRRAIMARLTAVADALIANADLTSPTELTAVVRDLRELAPAIGDGARRNLVGELLLGSAGPLTQTSGWMLLRFATEPDAAAQLRQEWDDVLAPDGPVDAATLAGLRRTEAFVREVTRLHPTNDRITRSAVVDTSVGGEPVPAGTRVILNVARLHSDPRFYVEPERFLPDRWLDGRPNTHKFAYVSFGVGGRRCLGETLAMVSLVALLPALTRAWDLSFAEHRSSETGRRQLAEQTEVTIRAR